MTTHYPELKEWASATDGVANAATGFDLETARAALPGRARPARHVARAARSRSGSGSTRDVVADARARIEPGAAARRPSCSPRPRRPSGARRGAHAAERERRRGRGRSPQRAGGARGRARGRDREGARVGGGRAREAALRRGRARPRRGAGRARGAPRRDPRRAPPRARPPAGAADAGRAAERRSRPPPRRGRRARPAAPSRRCARSTSPLPTTAPLAAGDPVEAPDAGVRGTIAAIEGDDGRGARQRRPPRADPARAAATRPPTPRACGAPEPAVRVVASARGDVSDQLDVRGMRAAGGARGGARVRRRRGARRASKTVRVVHGRGTGALRTAVRDELDRAPARRPPRAELVGRRDGCLADLIRTKAILEAESSNWGETP